MKVEKNEYRLLSIDCINSKWPAMWLLPLEPLDREYCQCGFKCKVRVEHNRGHIFYVDEQEYKKLKIVKNF